MCRPRSAIALPSQAGGGQRSTASSDAAADAVRRARHVPSAHSAVALPSRSGGGQRHKTASGAAAGVFQSRETSRPRAVCAPQLLSLAALAEGSSALQQRVQPLMRCDRARQARPVSSAPCSRSRQPHWRRTAPSCARPPALCSRSPKPNWRGAAPQGSIRCRRRRVAIAHDERSRAVRALQPIFPAKPAEGRATRTGRPMGIGPTPELGSRPGLR
jgi:hypothetical protein